ncbi:MAG: tRNA (adenosine(37)-N6)-threonylcarbamoyltransferase complex dimerization subunit type 1 TsaB, partial [Synergistaceae bacterium]|nr:tRNA (adenosine(37)-N6)-threonylcarbamoyltransferase complex dimerization subunit type 1 TsaB [Synergistaceae bacterium]
MDNIKILAIDCSLRLTCAALSGGGSFAMDLGRAQAAELPVKVEELLKNSGVSFSDINYIALANGPGYFTGIRVGAAYAAGLAFALGIKIIPVNSL